jgi:hypothetical protein
MDAAKVLIAELMKLQRSTGCHQIRPGCERGDEIQQVALHTPCGVNEDVGAPANGPKMAFAL